MDLNVNSPVLFILAGIIVTVVLAQSVFFLIKAWMRVGQVGVFAIAVSRVMHKRGVL